MLAEIQDGVDDFSTGGKKIQFLSLFDGFLGGFKINPICHVTNWIPFNCLILLFLFSVQTNSFY